MIHVRKCLSSQRGEPIFSTLAQVLDCKSDLRGPTSVQFCDIF